MNPINLDGLHLDRENLNSAAPRLMKMGLGIFGVGVLSSYAIGVMEGDALERLGRAYLVNFCYGLSLSLGALVFVFLLHLMRARWGVAVRRVAEIMAAIMPVWALLVIPLLPHLPQLYEWMHGGDGHELTGFKSVYFNKVFFFLRTVFCFAVWSVLSLKFLYISRRQDEDGDPQWTRRLESISPLSALLFGVTVTIFSFDFIMSLEVHWYSTIFGVYLFSGCFLGFLAALILMLTFIQRRGCLVDLVGTHHYHDLGRLMFAFVVFWAYIAFSQYMLIWYANIPEETVWYYKRQQGEWAAFSVILILGHFILPFLGLISQRVKRSPWMLPAWALWILIVHWLDIYWLIMPEFSEGRNPAHVLDFTTLLMPAGAAVSALAFHLRKGPLIAMRDPRLGESLSLH